MHRWTGRYTDRHEWRFTCSFYRSLAVISYFFFSQVSHLGIAEEEVVEGEVMDGDEAHSLPVLPLVWGWLGSLPARPALSTVLSAEQNRLPITPLDTILQNRTNIRDSELEVMVLPRTLPGRILPSLDHWMPYLIPNTIWYPCWKKNPWCFINFLILFYCNTKMYDKYRSQ